MDILTTFWQLLLIVILLGITIVVIGFAIATAIALIKASLNWVPKDPRARTIDTLEKHTRA